MLLARGFAATLFLTTLRRLAPSFALSLFLALCSGLPARAQSPSSTSAEFWPELDAHAQLPRNLRLFGFAGSRKGEDGYDYDQWNTGVALGYQLKRMGRSHPDEIDPDKDHYLVFGAGYEFLQTLSGTPKNENRFALEAFPRFRPFGRLLLGDRNRVEFRWVNGVYSTRYRNLLTGEFDTHLAKLRMTPYASAEFFYDGAASSWNEERYTAGLQWPYKRFLRLDTYYLRQHTTSGNPQNLNVGGLTLNFFF